MSAIRRANPTSVNWREKLSNLSSDSIVDAEVSSVNEGTYVEDYPFSSQDILEGKFSYRYHTHQGTEKKVRMTFYYRTGSGLFILHPGSRDDLVPEVIREFKQALVEDVRILPGLSISREGIWKFIESGKWLEITIEHKFKEYTLQNESDIEKVRKKIGEDVVGEQKVVKAKLSFKRLGSKISTTYWGDTISIPSQSRAGVPDPTLAPTLGSDSSFVIQKFEKEAIYKG